MTAVCKRTERATAAQSRDRANTSLMLTAADVAKLLACSTKTIYRLNDRGAMPQPVRLGGLLRWRRSQLEQWIAEGCPRPRNPTRNPARNSHV